MKEEKKSAFFGTAAVMAAIIVAAKALGLLRDVLIARTWGTTAPAVAYETASRLPVLIFDTVIGGVVSAAFIPVFSEMLVKEGKEAAMRYAAAYVRWILFISGAVTALGIVFASPLAGLLAPDLPPDTQALAAFLSRILLPMIVCTSLAFSFVGILQSMGEFHIPALISLVSNGIMVAYLLIAGNRFGIEGLAVAMLIGWAMQFLIQIPRLHGFGFRILKAGSMFSPQIFRSLKMALPILVGTWTQPLCAVINTRFASGMEEGRAITALGYANRLYTILAGVFSFVATNLLFPVFSRLRASGDRAESRRLMITSVKALVFIIAPIAAGLAVIAQPIAALLYERGEFTPADTLLTAAALRCYAAGMIFLAVNEVLTKALFAEEKPKLPMIASLSAMACNIGLVLVLSRFGVGGIALASGLASGVQCIISTIFMIRLTREKPSRADVLDLAKSILAATLMGGAVFAVQSVLPQGRIARTMLSVLTGVVVYALCTALMRSEEFGFLVKFVREKLPGKDKQKD